jgi:hypothetical protein
MGVCISSWWSGWSSKFFGLLIHQRRGDRAVGSGGFFPYRPDHHKEIQTPINLDILTFYIWDRFSQRILMIFNFYICTKFDNMYWGLRVEVPI